MLSLTHSLTHSFIHTFCSRHALYHHQRSSRFLHRKECKNIALWFDHFRLFMSSSLRSSIFAWNIIHSLIQFCTTNYNLCITITISILRILVSLGSRATKSLLTLLEISFLNVSYTFSPLTHMYSSIESVVKCLSWTQREGLGVNMKDVIEKKLKHKIKTKQQQSLNWYVSFGRDAWESHYYLEDDVDPVVQMLLMLYSSLDSFWVEAGEGLSWKWWSLTWERSSSLMSTSSTAPSGEGMRIRNWWGFLLLLWPLQLEIDWSVSSCSSRYLSMFYWVFFDPFHQYVINKKWIGFQLRSGFGSKCCIGKTSIKSFWNSASAEPIIPLPMPGVIHLGSWGIPRMGGAP